MADDIELMNYMAGSDWLGIGLAVLASFFIGFIWFTFLFGKRWAKEFDMAMDDSNGGMAAMWPSMVKDIVGAFLTAYVLWHSMMYAVPSVWADTLGASGAENNSAIFYGLMTGVFIWLGYFVPVSLSRTGWEGRSWAWFGIDVGYQLVRLCAMGVLLGVFASEI